jgi:hypothetical protein
MRGGVGDDAKQISPRECSEQNPKGCEQPWHPIAHPAAAILNQHGLRKPPLEPELTSKSASNMALPQSTDRQREDDSLYRLGQFPRLIP